MVSSCDSLDCTGGEYNIDLDSFYYQEDPWATRYPIVVNIFDDMPCTPVHNSIQHNTFCALNLSFGLFYDEVGETNIIGDNVRAGDCDSDDDTTTRDIVFRDFSQDGDVRKPQVA